MANIPAYTPPAGRASETKRVLRDSVLVWAFGSGLLGCTSTPPAKAVDEAVVIRAKFVRGQQRRPPNLWYRLDLELRNPSQDPRWLLWTSERRSEYTPDPGPLVTNLYVVEDSAEPRVVRMILEPVGLDAVRLPGRSRLTLTGNIFPAAFYDAVPKSIPFEVVVATEVLVDGRPLASYLTTSPTSDADAVVEITQLNEPVQTWIAPKGGVELELVVERREARELRLPPID